LERWRAQGIDIAIFSSGSVQAQRSLFRNSVAGDLTRFIRAYFDTTTGPKREPESYQRIAGALGRPPSNVLFLSDIVEELDAASEAGMQTGLCVRGSGEALRTRGHPVLHSFDQVPLSP
jgi:enolase-phosphatase E1